MVSGRNLDWLRNYVSLNIVNGQRVGTDLLEHVNEKISRSSRSNPFVASFSGKAAREAIKINEIEAIIKLCLTHLMLDPAVKIRPFAFPLIQSAVYQTRQGAPLVKVNNHGVAINLMWLQHTVHFFKWHLKGQQGDGELTEAYNALSPGERPRGWPSRLEGGTKSLAGRWKGTFCEYIPLGSKCTY